VQRVATGKRRPRRAAIFDVTGDRPTRSREVHAHLVPVGATRLYLDEGEASATLQRSKARDAILHPALAYVGRRHHDLAGAARHEW
jgi:hypothetical protein